MSAASPDLTHLEGLLGHAFADRARLAIAATHPSATGRTGGAAFERLEFLGDRVLGLAMAEILHSRFPEEREGDLALRFTALVRRETLCAVMEETGLAAAIAIGPGQGGGAQGRTVVLSDAFEALVAALFLDGGLTPVRAFIATAFASRLDRPATRAKDAKTSLQEFAMARGWPLPRYVHGATQGPPHDPRFAVTVAVEPPGAEAIAAPGEGGSKRAAEQAAAAALLERLGSSA